MFQIGPPAWLDVQERFPGTPEYLPNVFDPEVSSAVAAAYLNIRLIRRIGMQRYTSGDYTADDLKTAISDYHGSPIKESYANEIWDCAQALKAGDWRFAMRAIHKIP